MGTFERFAWPVRPVAVKENCVTGDCFRFTVLTPGLIRMEYHPDGAFEDRASQRVFYRDFPACPFTQEVRGNTLVLRTEKLELQYLENAAFSEQTLSVRLLTEPASCWKYGEDFEDLGGTTSTLDAVNGRRTVERGVCSRNGFSVLDDSDSLVLDETGWVDVRQFGGIDCYFFGFGFDYIGSVQALYRLTGVPPLLPAYALGNWWSRYYPYNQQEYLDLMDRFREEKIPLSIGVVDMDWHITKIPEELKDPDNANCRSGWTGYTWNTEYFPDYKTFLKELHKRNLRTTLNLHPAAGVCAHEVQYKEMAAYFGIDPASCKRVPFNILSKEYMAKYFDVLHHPYEEDGVDFWWMDWQQGTSYWWIHEPNKPGEYQDPRERLDPLWMLNHLHILDISRSGKRPMFFSRYCGPGSQRYPVGFSGDTLITWESLQFQPEFTATSSNIGYGWWSHDIGGHMGGMQDHELFTRWVQYGVFSPITRLHSAINPLMYKEPWLYPEPYRSTLVRFLQLRHRLFPYLYTMNRRNHEELLPLVQPMYYTHPKNDGAYQVPNQYWFGSELIAAPVTEPINASGTAAAKVWLPKGHWFDFFTGLRYASRRGRHLKACRTVEEMPVFAKAGAIVPMADKDPQDNELIGTEQMEVLVFPGADNVFVLYEDGGDGYDFETGSYAETVMELNWSDAPTFTVHGAKGCLSVLPEYRSWRIGLRGFHREVTAEVFVDGKPVQAEQKRDGNTLWLTVSAPISGEIRVEVQGEHLLTDNPETEELCRQVLRRANCTFEDKKSILQNITKEGWSVQQKNKQLNWYFAHVSATDAVVELLSLTEDPYLGNQEPTE